MRGKVFGFVIALSAIGVLALAPVGSGAGSITKVKCSAKYTSLTPTKLKGQDVGFVACGTPFGKGIQLVKYVETVSAAGNVTASGPSKVWFDLGTLRGTYKLSGKLVGAAGTFAGSTRITGGTGAYKGARATGKLSCQTTDAGATLRCKFTLHFTHL